MQCFMTLYAVSALLLLCGAAVLLGRVQGANPQGKSRSRA
jgi:hypothetical protein